MEAFSVGARVERVNSPRDSLVADGVQGVVVDVLQADNGELGYFVRVAAGAPPVFCAGSRLRAVSESPATS